LQLTHRLLKSLPPTFSLGTIALLARR